VESEVCLYCQEIRTIEEAEGRLRRVPFPSRNRNIGSFRIGYIWLGIDESFIWSGKLQYLE